MYALDRRKMHWLRLHVRVWGQLMMRRVHSRPTVTLVVFRVRGRYFGLKHYVRVALIASYARSPAVVATSGYDERPTNMCKLELIPAALNAGVLRFDFTANVCIN
jgi:hypothetical protein